MKKIIVILTVLGILSAFFSTSFAAPDVRIEGRDPVVYVEKQRHENVFDSSVKPGEVPPEIAYALFHKDLPVYAPEEMKKSRLKKLNHRNFPIRLEKEKTWVEYFVDKEGKISKREKSSVKSNKDFVFEFFWRVLLGSMVLLVSIFNSFFCSREKGKKLAIFYLVIVGIVIFLAAIGVSVCGFAGEDTGAIAGGFVGALAGGFVSAIAGGFVGAIAGGYADKVAGEVAGAFAGGYAGLFAGLFAGMMGWQNAGINDYLIFLVIVCLLSFVISRIAKFAVDKIKKQVATA